MNLDFAYGVLPDREWRTLPSGVRVLRDAEGPILQLSHHPDPLKFPNHAILQVEPIPAPPPRPLVTQGPVRRF